MIIYKVYLINRINNYSQHYYSCEPWLQDKPLCVNSRAVGTPPPKSQTPPKFMSDDYIVDTD